MANEVSRKLNIYEVDELLENALLYGVDEWGEILDEEQIKELVDKFETTISKKLGYMGDIVVNSESFIGAIDDQIKKLQDKKKTLTNGINRTKNYLDNYIRHTFTDENGVLDTVGLNKFKLETPSITISYRKSNSLEVTDINNVPSEYIKTVVEEKVDKVGLKKFMKESKVDETDYAYISTNINMSIK